jgi:hypothetical protein
LVGIVCGSGRNRDHFAPYFTKIFSVRIDDDKVRRRRQGLTPDDWELGSDDRYEELLAMAIERMLELNRSAEKPARAKDLDATQLLNQVVDELLRFAI